MIRMNDFVAEPEELQRQELEAGTRALRSGKFILGDEVRAFENAWARYCGTRFCVGTANGMDALEIGLRALNLGPGCEIITTPMTAIATIVAIMHAGATPVLADIDPRTALLDPESVQRCLSDKTKALLLVHLYGQIRDMETWLGLCRTARLHLLEDCAQAHGAFWNNQYAGTFGTWGAFSFYPTKNLGARGDAGALVTNFDQVAARAVALRNYGTTKPYQHPVAGLNSRLDEIQAAILSARLSWLQRFNARRQEIAARFFAELRNPQVQPLAEPAPGSHVFHLFVVRCAERERLVQYLAEREIETAVHYPVAAHEQGCCKNVRCDPQGLKHATAHAAQCLSLPCHPQLSDDDVTTVVAAINEFR